LKGVNLSRLPLACSKLVEAHLEGAYLRDAHLENADLDTAHLEGARLYRANFTRANLRYAYFDRTSNLDSVDLDNTKVVDVRWGDVKLALVAWERIEVLGDEVNARGQKKPKRNDPEEQNAWLRAYRRAIRANRQVATILRDQGWNDKADVFDYH